MVFVEAMLMNWWREGGLPTRTPRVVVSDLAGESNCATFCPMQALTRSLFKILIREREFLYFGLMHRCENENFFLSFSCFLSVNLVLQDENEKLKLNSQSRRGENEADSHGNSRHTLVQAMNVVSLRKCGH